MATQAIELCDAGFHAAACDGGEPRLIAFTDDEGAPEWPGFAYHDGQKLWLGRVAEDAWFVHPRRVSHTFWSRLAHEPAVLSVPGKVPSFSELAFLFLRDFLPALAAAAGPAGKLVLAVPGAYLKDPATEEEKVGLLLGMASELKLPLAGIIDMAAAALCDPRAGGFNPALPVVVVDVQLQAAELSLFEADQLLHRRQFLQLPQSGSAQLLKHLTSTMGNRFLRHSAFDILEDGRIEQIFYQQTKNFVLTGAPEFRYQINTARRHYEMHAKHEQLRTDAQAFVATVMQGLQAFVEKSPAHAPDGCTVALTHRAVCVPGLEAKLWAAGYRRLLRLPAGAAACGAARTAHPRLAVPAEMSDVAVETAVPLADARRSLGAQWETRLQKMRATEARPPPTHAILNGIGHPIGQNGHFVIGAGGAVDLSLAEPFHTTENCTVPLVREDGRLWLVDPTPAATESSVTATPFRTSVDAGDRLMIRCGTAQAEVLFVHCPEGKAPRG